MGWRAILLVLATFPSLLKCELLPIRTYTTADGLAADRVHSIVADARGFLWFCTPEGLSRFDGYRFVTYGVDEGLPHQMAYTLIETRSGDHWIGTPRGVSRITAGEKGARLTNYKMGPDNAVNGVGVLLQTRSGRILAATTNEVFEWTDSREFRRMELRSQEKMGIGDMVEDREGRLWIGSATGLYLLGEHGIAQTFTAKEGLPGSWVEMILPDSKGRLWVAVRGGLALMSRHGTEQWSVEKTYTVKAGGLVGDDVKALLEAKDETLWVGTTMGISRLRLGAGEQTGFQNLTRAQGLSDRAIIALAEDPAGNIWAGTESAGVMRIDRHGFTTYREQDGLPTDRMFSVFEDRSGGVLAAALAQEKKRGRSLAIFDGARFHGVAPKVFAENPSWGWNQVVLQSRTGEWWAATSEGLCRYKPMKASELDGRKPEICYGSDIIFRLFEDSKGGIWASGQSKRGDQLMRWDPGTNTVFNFPSPRVAGEPTDDLVSAFAEDPHGNIWMGLFRGGMYRYNGRRFEVFQRNDGVPGGSIFALLSNQDGLWIGSNGGGLARIENTGDARPRVEIYNTARGMASNIVHCIADDGEGRIYAGTGKSVDQLDPKTGHIRHFSSANGLAHGTFRSAFRDHSGALWFATTQGVSRLIPAADRAPVKPPVFITDLRIGSKVYPLSQLGETRISQLELQPSQNQLQVEFVGIDYEPGDAIRYSYKLEGSDSGWSPPRSQQTVNYAALAGGTYHFLVKAVTSDGAESATPAEVDFTVLPPIWKRWWFECLLAAAVAALVFAAHRYRMAQMMSLERVRTAIATDLHDDIGASLSQIAILSEVARVGGNGQGRPGEPLERVAALARELVDSMGDIVWSIRSEPHGMDSLIRRMREFALDVLDSQGIEFELRTTEGAEGVQLSLQARRHLFLIFKECIHNAARHSHCTSVMAEMKVADREVLLTVEDNGVGLSSEGKAQGFTGGMGIPSMHKRAEGLGGRMEMGSKPGGGCCVTIHLPTRHGVLARQG